MLVGRARESAQIDEVLDAARRRRSGALVVRGEAGIGKTALLAAAVERAGDMRVVHALGVESEVEMPFSGLHQLLRPILDYIGALPGSQGSALRSALALGSDATDRLAAYAGALSLVAAAAERQPLLCVVDDAHWLDDASAGALAFVARRLDADGVAMLFAVREPEVRGFEAPGMPDLQLHGLDRGAARQLLAGRLPPDAAPRFAEELTDVAAGNPLALIELPWGLRPAQVAGDEPLGEPLRAAPAVEAVFLRRLRDLDGPTRAALLVLAASDTGDVQTITPALAPLDAEASLEAAESAGLVTVGATIEFTHPLARSAIYGAADESRRREAHRALAAAAQAAGEEDRHAWHLAAASAGPDETVASALVAAAASARRRGGVWSEAKALERAARLTPDAGRRARRLIRAGVAAYRAGRPEHADALLEEARSGTLEVSERARADAQRAQIRLDRGEFDDALRLMLDGAQAVEQSDPAAAATLLTNAATVAQHRLDVEQADGLAKRAWRLAGSAATDDAGLCHAWSFQQVLAGRVREGIDLAVHCADLVEADGDGGILVADAASTLMYAGELAPAQRLLERAVAHGRSGGALGDLGYALHMYSQLEWYSGNLRRAYAHALEALQIVEELGTRQVLDGCLERLATFEAVLGRADDCRRHAQDALASALRLGDRRNEVRARGALGLLALSSGDPETAVSQLSLAVAALERGGHGNPNQIRVVPDLVEASLRLGEPEAVEHVVSELERRAKETYVPWTRAVALRCRGLVTRDDDAALAAFEAALRVAEPSAFERGRTELCLGERLRRAGARRAAHAHLSAALEAFEATGAAPFAERARTELRASGLTPRRRTTATLETLTPQELQISALVADGLSNRDVAAALFVSPKTVEFHLTRVYRKLEIRSRSELVRRMADDGRLRGSADT